MQKLRASPQDLEALKSQLDEERRSVERELADTLDRIEDLNRRILELEKAKERTVERLDRKVLAEKEKPFWSFEPLEKPPVPDLEDSWIRNPIDAFLAEKHRELGLVHSARADRRTLIRRLFFDLHGLPPTPTEVEDFLKDPSPDAYEKLVDRLLDSPRYGERWARHWLDVVHYGDTHGYDKDKRRPHAWPYRDYVIRSLNEDKPYSRFAKEQIAGDILFPNDPMGVVATGFIAAGPWDFVGHVELREGTRDKKITRNLDRDDMVTNTMSTFMSLTVHCARCHDHKFDPIDQQDYYRLQAVFAGIDRADRPYDPDPKTFRKRKRLMDRAKDLEAQEQKGKAWISAVTSEILAELDRERVELKARIERAEREESSTNGYHSAISTRPSDTKWVQVDLGEVVVLDRVILHPARPTDFPDTPGFGFPVRFRIDGSREESFENRFPIADQTQEDYPNPGDRPVEFSGQGMEVRFIRITATKLWERSDDFVFALGEMQVLSDGRLVSEGKPVRALDTIDAGRWNRNHLVDGYNSRTRLGSGNPESAEALGDRYREIEDARREAALALLPVASREIVLATERELAEVRESLSELPDPQWVYGAASDFKPIGSFRPPQGIRPVHLLARGSVSRPGQEMKPGGLSALDHAPTIFEMEHPGREGERRAALAAWIAHPDNAFFWRSIVNRVWHYHFGRGIVDTPNDFGKMGGEPTHPELLDWLAVSFREQGESLKWLHKLIVTSAAYQQVSSDHEGNRKIDAGNRYLWRMNRQRLDAESLRDSVLYVSGKLDLSMGGPGYDLFGFINDHSPHYLYEKHDVDDPRTLRRTVYRFIVRSVPDPFMECLDCADPSQIVPVRNRTLTPLQALALLNNPLMIRQTEHFANRLAREADDLAGRIDRAYQLCLARLPDRQEKDLLVAYAKKHGLPAACRVVFNCNEFMFID